MELRCRNVRSSDPTKGVSSSRQQVRSKSFLYKMWAECRARTENLLMGWCLVTNVLTNGNSIRSVPTSTLLILTFFYYEYTIEPLLTLSLQDGGHGSRNPLRSV